MNSMFATVFLLLGFCLVASTGTGNAKGKGKGKNTTPTTTTTTESDYDYFLINWRDPLIKNSLSCELGNAVAKARSLPTDGPFQNLSTLITATEGIYKTLTNLIGKNGTLVSNITKPMRRNLRILTGNVKDIFQKYKGVLNDVDLIKRILKTSRHYIMTPYSGYGNVGAYLNEIDALFSKSTKWWNVYKSIDNLYNLGKTLKLNLSARSSIDHQKAKSKMNKLHNKIASLKIIVMDIISNLTKSKKNAETFLNDHGKEFVCKGCLDSNDSYCLSGICRPGHFGYACQLENDEFGRCTRLGEGNVTTYNGYVYTPNEIDTNELTFYPGGTFLSFSISDIAFVDAVAAITVTLMEEEYTLMANGTLNVNGRPGPLPLTKTYRTPQSPINGKVAIQQDGHTLVLQSSIHQLTVEFSTDGSDDVSVSLSVYWETLVSGKCGNFDRTTNLD
ncbi:unnamed protein product [Owenia fusiformis]|uniref:VWFD domain-containing protein n=1 Tax=Owenia fusiformis TaxID=6347 RepID=A0A8S4NGQ6_OWEFU|nr:unnamed protein product [Owenia fusiformis]